MIGAIELARDDSGVKTSVVIRAAFADTEPHISPDSVICSLEASARSRPNFTGKLENLVEISDSNADGTNTLFLVGLGSCADLNLEKLRKAFAHLGRRLSDSRVDAVTIDIVSTIGDSGIGPFDAGQVLGEALGLLSWDGGILRGRGTDSRPHVVLHLTCFAPAKEPDAQNELFRAGIERGLKLAESSNLARTISQTPPNIASPYWIAERAGEIANEAGLSLRVLRGDTLENEKLVGLTTVGKASDNPSCLIRLEYRPAGTQENARPLVLIGKTITYDTGGLSLKINNGMVGMKRDKDGGCAVLGAMHAIGTVIRPGFPVVGLLVAAENSVSQGAMRPDDVITYRNGVTVEITNTDAEGRLVLADALCWACEVENAAAIVDLATLTGGVVTALGSTYAGLFCQNDALRTALDHASDATGERIWRLPMHEEYREMMKSPVADIVNSNPNRKAHPIQGAAFLSYFVTDTTPWAHIDIAGVHAVDSDKDAYIKGPTGFGVRLLAELAKNWKSPD